MAVSSDKTVKYKLVLGFLLIIAMFVSFGIISLTEVHTVGSLTKTIYDHPLVVSNAALSAGHLHDQNAPQHEGCHVIKIH